jgi:hypothetical protein
MKTVQTKRQRVLEASLRDASGFSNVIALEKNARFLGGAGGVRGRGCPVRGGRGARGALSDTPFGVRELVPAFDSPSQSGNKLPHSIIGRHPLPPLTVHPHPRPLSRKRARGGKWGCAHTKLGDGRRRGALGSGFVEMQQGVEMMYLLMCFVWCCDIIERCFLFALLFNST